MYKIKIISDREIKKTIIINQEKNIQLKPKKAENDSYNTKRLNVYLIESLILIY